MLNYLLLALMHDQSFILVIVWYRFYVQVQLQLNRQQVRGISKGSERQQTHTNK